MRKGREALAERLERLLRGSVLSAEEDLRPYLRDQSIYQIEPQLVALPVDVADMQQLVRFAAAEGVPLTARGGGSGTAGSALGQGIVVALPDTSCWREIGPCAVSGATAQVRAAAGVQHNHLQDYLGHRGFFLPADVSSAEVSRIGGNIATKASGPHALRYGSIDRFIDSLEFVTARGELVNTADEASIPRRLREQLAELEAQLHADQAAWSLLQRRRALKTASGYNLFAFLEEQQPFGRRLARLLAGSVGTLGLVVSATLCGEPRQEGRAVVLLYFDDLVEAARAVSLLRELAVSAIEVISRETVAVLRQLTELPVGLAVDAHLLLVEFSGAAVAEEAKRVVGRLQAERLRWSMPPSIAGDTDRIGRLWALRKQILWLIRHPQPGYRALAVVNDVGVPPENLAPFVAEAEQVFARHQLTALIYGHAGSGNLHLRPLFDITLPGLAGRIRDLADDIYESVLRHDGTITAEHGMGRLRAPYLEREWGPALYGYMRRLKAIFDPDGVFNPEVMFSDRPITDHLRPDLLLH